MSLKTIIKEGAKKLFTKKKPAKKDFKTDLSSYPTKKNIDELISKEGDPFVRGKLLSYKEKMEKGTVVGKDGNVVGTPTKERSAKTLMDRNRGSRQYKKIGGRMGLKNGSAKGCKLAMKGKGKAYGKNS